MRNTYYTTPALSEALTPQDPPSETLRMPPPPYRMVVTVSADEGSPKLVEAYEGPGEARPGGLGITPRESPR